MFFPCLESLPTPSHLLMLSVTFVTGSTNDTHIPSPCWLTNTQCNFQWVTKPRVTPDSYHSTLGLHDNHDRVFPLLGNRTFRLTPRVSYTHTEILDISTGLLHPHRNSGYLHGSLTPTQKFWISHPHRNSGYLHGSLTPTQKFWISPQVLYTHREILDTSTGLLHPHRNSGYLHDSLTPTQKFLISARVFYTHIEILDISMGLLHPHRIFRILLRVSFTQFPGFSPEGINDPLLVSPNTH